MENVEFLKTATMPNHLQMYVSIPSIKKAIHIIRYNIKQHYNGYSLTVNEFYNSTYSREHNNALEGHYQTIS